VREPSPASTRSSSQSTASINPAAPSTSVPARASRSPAIPT
jgi:hypothetical protein